MSKENLDSVIKRAEDDINKSLMKIVEDYKIDSLEVYTNYMEHYRNVIKYNPNIDDSIDVAYDALRHTIKSYESLYPFGKVGEE